MVQGIQSEVIRVINPGDGTIEQNGKK